MNTRTSWKVITVVAVLMIGLAVISERSLSAEEDYVVIANKANPANSISTADLRQMFLGSKAAWPNGSKVTPVMSTPESPDYGAVIKKTTGMTGADFKRYFIQLSFLGKVVPPPRSVESPTAVVHFVSTYAGAIGCVPASVAGAGVKTLKVE